MTSASSRPTSSSRGVAEGRLGGRVDLDDVPAAVHRDDAVEGGVEDRALARLALADALLGAAALDELPDLRPEAAHRGQQLVVRRDARGGEELHDAEHASRRSGSGRRRPSAGPPRRPRRRAAAGVDARRRRRSRPAGRYRQTSPGMPWPGASITDRLASAKAPTGVNAALPRVRAAQERALGIGGYPEGAEVPPQRLADRRQQARVGVVLVGRRGEDARDRVLRAQEHGDVGSLGARGHDRRDRVRRASHIRWAPAPAPAVDRPRRTRGPRIVGAAPAGTVPACPPPPSCTSTPTFPRA